MSAALGKASQAAARYSFLGGGNMATAMIGGLISQGISPDHINVVAPSDTTRRRLHAAFHVQVQPLPDARWRAVDVIVLAVKPQQLREAATALRPYIEGQLIVSLVAGARLTTLHQLLGPRRVVRAMPNVGARTGQGLTGLLASPEQDQDDRMAATTLAMAVGHYMWVDSEAELDAVTALSGSGPAYFFYLLEAIEDAAVAMGLNPSQGRILAAEILIGAASLSRLSSETGRKLREQVTSKGGTTEAAIRVLNEHDTKNIFIRAIRAAAERGQGLDADI